MWAVLSSGPARPMSRVQTAFRPHVGHRAHGTALAARRRTLVRHPRAGPPAAHRPAALAAGTRTEVRYPRAGPRAVHRFAAAADKAADTAVSGMVGAGTAAADTVAVGIVASGIVASGMARADIVGADIVAVGMSAADTVAAGIVGVGKTAAQSAADTPAGALGAARPVAEAADTAVAERVAQQRAPAGWPPGRPGLRSRDNPCRLGVLRARIAGRSK